MSTKLGQIVNAQEGLEILVNLKFKAKKLFEVSKFVELATKEIESFNKVREEKIKQYGEKIEVDGKELFSVSEDNKDTFLSEITDLLETEIEIDVPEIRLEDFGDVEMSPKQYLSLKWFIKEENNGN